MQVRAEAIAAHTVAGESMISRWNADVTLAVSLPGGRVAMVTQHCALSRQRYPVAGMVVPVAVDPADPAGARILWDEVPSIDERIATRHPEFLDPPALWRRVREAIRAGADAAFETAQPGVAPWRDAARRMLEERPGAQPDADEADPPPPPPGPDVGDGRVRGSAWVLSSTSSREGNAAARHGGWLLLCVEVDGWGRWLVHRRGTIRSDRLARRMPVAVQVTEPYDVELLWDEVPDVLERAAHGIRDATARAAAQLADAEQASVDWVMANLTDPAMRAQVQAMLGGEGVAAAPAAADPADALARLDRLRAAGVLTGEEHAAERARVLQGL